MAKQVFVDETGRRRGLMGVLGIALALGLLGFTGVIVATVFEHLR
ncbi:hypothetical protein FHS29_004443 [Saccharothrix tamanrassetensis]|uniref:Uncharacterized protein n=1 Tax=Saccharothrix tamanrassetensis TaxID=1051531 RepID=A0A841CNY3_9PSEU|nr:hypothetical protein [Saccharothrix tamanrassetensis]MBB5957848.1 hypothetical protein [Saccharothrix tamanrassetensis]